jgi:hypothetical protein
MRQRIAILSASFKENCDATADAPCTDVATGNSLKNFDGPISREVLCQQFYRPHSWMDSKVVNKKQSAAQIHEKVEDRGGRINLKEKESRSQMPEWTTERTIGTSSKNSNKSRKKRSPQTKRNPGKQGNAK